MNRSTSTLLLRLTSGSRLSLGALTFCAISTLSWADVSLPAIISDHAVLQKSAKTNIWGKADPGEKVVVTLGTAKAETTAGSDGKWKVGLDLTACGAGPFDLLVEGKNKLAIKDVVVGEAWICSGQSNMEFTLLKTDEASNEIPKSSNPFLRQFLVTKKSTPTPQDDCEGKWTVAGPATSGAFSGVGYYFGKKLQQELKVPVGLINSSWGGSIIEAWMSEPTLDQHPELKAKKDAMLADIRSMPERLADFQKRYKAWAEKYQREDKAGGQVSDFAMPAVDTKAWQTVKLPGEFAKAGLPDAGAIWIRHNVSIPANRAGHAVYVDLGIISQFDSIYWNGEKVGETTADAPGSLEPRHYLVPGTLVKAGDNLLAVRIFSPKGGASVFAENLPFKVGDDFFLTGDWQAKAEYELPKLSEAVLAEYVIVPPKLPESQFRPCCLFDGMIAPLLPYTIAGVVWYQGESNATRAVQYRSSFPTLIKDWRAAWGQGDFPFYWCQLANFTLKKNQPDLSSWAELREAQTGALSLPHTGQAVLIDLGEEDDIHPRNKSHAGERLSLVALANTYGRKDLAFAGPLFQEAAIEGDKVRVKFKNPEVGLVANALPAVYKPKSGGTKERALVRNSPESELEGFAICGSDGKWKWAQAKIDRDTVLVWSPDVPKPVAVRYAWATNPTCNLYSRDGLPAVPFRTDNFPVSTQANKF